MAARNIRIIFQQKFEHPWVKGDLRTMAIDAIRKTNYFCSRYLGSWACFNSSFSMRQKYETQNYRRRFDKKPQIRAGSGIFKKIKRTRKPWKWGVFSNSYSTWSSSKFKRCMFLFLTGEAAVGTSNERLFWPLLLRIGVTDSLMLTVTFERNFERKNNLSR